MLPTIYVLFPLLNIIMHTYKYEAWQAFRLDIKFEINGQKMVLGLGAHVNIVLL